jgi:hypothetical protein
MSEFDYDTSEYEPAEPHVEAAYQQAHATDELTAAFRQNPEKGTKRDRHPYPVRSDGI